jgi:hypothetical protein
MVLTAGTRLGVYEIVAPLGAGGGRVYFRHNNAMLVSTVGARGGLAAGSPGQLFDGGWALGGDSDYSPTPDGKSFLMSQRRPEAIPTRITIVFHWFEELARRMSQR